MILLDEKIGGTVHLAVGRSYPETGGVNESAVHWDMICDLRRGGRLSADGEPILEDGELRSEAARRRSPRAPARRVVDGRQRAHLVGDRSAPPRAGPGRRAGARPPAAARRASPRSAGRSRGAFGARCRARRRRPRGRPPSALNHWSSANSGSTTSGTPWASAPSVEPWPPWVTTAAACASTSSCGTQRSTVTLRRQRAELAEVAVLADREQEARGQRRERLDRRAVERAGSSGRCAPAVTEPKLT